VKVLYDVSVLGAAELDETARTGVYRFTAELGRKLAGAPDISLEFSTLQNSLLYKYAKTCVSDFIPYQVPFIESKIRKPKQGKQAGKERLVSWVQFLVKKVKGGFPDSIKEKLDKIRQTRSWHLASLGTISSELIKVIEEFDILHLPWFIDKSLSQLRNVKIFLTIHDLLPLRFPNLFSYSNRESFLRNLRSINDKIWIHCVSNSTRNDVLELLKKKVNPDRVFVVPLAASNHFRRIVNRSVLEEIKGKYGIPSNAQYLLSICTLEPRKNLVSALRAFSIVAQKKDHIKFLLVGTKGWHYKKIFKLVQDLGIGNDVIFTGYVLDEDLPALYSAAMCFVYPSYYEGFGLPPLEAMSCGVPVVVSNRASLPEVVGNAGLYVDPDDVEGIAKSITRILNNDCLRKELSEKAMKRASLFSWEKTVRDIIAMYRLSRS